MKRALQVILAISVGGAAFSGVLSYREVFGHSAALCPSSGAPGTVFGYPACVYGFFMFVVLAGTALAGLIAVRRCTLATRQTDCGTRAGREVGRYEEGIDDGGLSGTVVRGTHRLSRKGQRAGRRQAETGITPADSRDVNHPRGKSCKPEMQLRKRQCSERSSLRRTRSATGLRLTARSSQILQSDMSSASWPMVVTPDWSRLSRSSIDSFSSIKG